MFGTTGKTAWRLLAAVPFVLLLGIVGIKVTAGDPNSPFNQIPGAQVIQELGEEAPTSDVQVKLPKSKSPKPSASATSASASASASDAPTAAATKPAPKPTTKKATPKPAPATSSPTKEPTKEPTTEPTREPTAQEKCEAEGKTWRQGLMGNWFCSAL